MIDNQGVARVGDVGDEQPLLTRDESANMSNGALIAWDGTDQRAETVTGNIGSDTKPIKIIGGMIAPVNDDVINTSNTQQIKSGVLGVNTLFIDGSIRQISPVSDSNGIRTQMKVYNQSADRYAILDLRADNNGKVVLFLQIRKISDGSYVNGQEIASIQ